jgi:hypothetical protein
MTDQEREQVLKMIENGTITPEDGLKLMRTLDSTPAEEDAPVEPVESQAQPVEAAAVDNKAGGSAERSNFDVDPRISRIKSTVSRLWQIPLWIGVLFTVLSAWGMYALVQASRFNFWFFCLGATLLLGVLVIVAAIGSRTARWIFVDVHQKPGESPARIFLGFPLPLKFAAWFVRTFKHRIPGLEKGLKDANIDEILEVFETGMGSESMVVNVDEGEHGEKVRVYIG